jgi:hypothetical protein
MREDRLHVFPWRCSSENKPHIHVGYVVVLPHPLSLFKQDLALRNYDEVLSRFFRIKMHRNRVQASRWKNLKYVHRERVEIGERDKDRTKADCMGQFSCKIPKPPRLTNGKCMVLQIEPKK